MKDSDFNIQSHLDLSDDDFIRKFADCTLDPVLFTHEAHLRLAWIHLTRYGVDMALVNIRMQIAQYDRVFGDGIKYHETVTVAAVHVVHHFIGKSKTTSFAGFISEFPRLKEQFKSLLAQHYSQDIFINPIAKSRYVAPDILPFDNDM